MHMIQLHFSLMDF